MDRDRYVGAPVVRREDPALLTGRAEYTEDLTAPGMAHMAVRRSRYGHARIEHIDVEAAVDLEGVVGGYTATDIEASDAPGVLPVRESVLDADVPGHPLLAGDRVRYHGQPVAVAIAEDRYAARDAADAVEVDYERLPAVTDLTVATAGDSVALFEAAPDNVLTERELGEPAATDQAFADADRVVDLAVANNRVIPSAIEPRAALARWGPADGRLTVEMTSQSPHRHRSGLAETLGLPEQKVRVRAPDVGGGFGHKGHHYPGEALAAWCAIELDRPVKWTATRTANSLAGAHARDHATTAELAVDEDGSIRGLRVETTANIGAYVLGGAPAIPTYVYGGLLTGQYDIPTVDARVTVAATNTAPVHSYRGAGRPEAIYLVERLADRAARELGLDPAEFRRRNQVQADMFPYETAVGSTYDSGDYRRALDAALAAAGYDDLCERRARLREDGRYLGVGLACYVESTGAGFESGVVRIHPSGGVTVYAGTHSHGQGHGTTYAQIVADELGVSMAAVEVVEGDTESVPEGTGTFGSRSTVVGGSAVVESARGVREAARRIAAHELEADPGDLEFRNGEFQVAGAPGRSIAFGEVASVAYGGDLPDGVDRGLESTTFFEPEEPAYTFGTHIAIVEVDPVTGEVDVERYLAVDDCGERINPRIVEGQVHGGVAQGLGQALYETVEYDDSGQLTTGSLQNYAVPKATQLPEVETDATVTPSPHNPLGVKGIGEAGTIAAPPAVVNAVCDALAPLGVDHVDMPLTAERIWRAASDS